MAKPPSSERVRLTISVSPEAHAVYKRMADATGTSLGRIMGEWLDDTSEGAQMIALKLEQARSAPKLVVQEMQAMLVGMQDQVTDLLSDIRSGKKVLRLPQAQSSEGAPLGDGPSSAPEAPRPVIRGGKSTTSTTKGHNPRGSRG